MEEGEKALPTRADESRVMAAPSRPGDSGWFRHTTTSGGPAQRGLGRRQTPASTGPAWGSLPARGSPWPWPQGPANAAGQVLGAGKEWHCRYGTFIIHVCNYFFPDSPQHFTEELGC